MLNHTYAPFNSCASSLGFSTATMTISWGAERADQAEMGWDAAAGWCPNQSYDKLLTIYKWQMQIY